jgi:hypothetical protein
MKMWVLMSPTKDECEFRSVPVTSPFWGDVSSLVVITRGRVALVGGERLPENPSPGEQ